MRYSLNAEKLTRAKGTFDEQKTRDRRTARNAGGHGFRSERPAARHEYSNSIAIAQPPGPRDSARIREERTLMVGNIRGEQARARGLTGRIPASEEIPSSNRRRSSPRPVKIVCTAGNNGWFGWRLQGVQNQVGTHRAAHASTDDVPGERYNLRAKAADDTAEQKHYLRPGTRSSPR